MRSWLHGLTLIAALAAASSALAQPAPDSRGERSLARMLDGRTAGQPVSCIDPRRAYTTEIIDKTALVYRMPGGKLYVNRPQLGVKALDNDAIMNVRTRGGVQLCERDVVSMVDRGGRGPARGMGAVGLGKFVPYSKAER